MKQKTKKKRRRQREKNKHSSYKEQTIQLQQQARNGQGHNYGWGVRQDKERWEVGSGGWGRGRGRQLSRDIAHHRDTRTITHIPIEVCMTRHYSIMRNVSPHRCTIASNIFPLERWDPNAFCRGWGVGEPNVRELLVSADIQRSASGCRCSAERYGRRRRPNEGGCEGVISTHRAHTNQGGLPTQQEVEVNRGCQLGEFEVIDKPQQFQR